LYLKITIKIELIGKNRKRGFFTISFILKTRKILFFLKICKEKQNWFLPFSMQKKYAIDMRNLLTYAFMLIMKISTYAYYFLQI